MSSTIVGLQNSTNLTNVPKAPSTNLGKDEFLKLLMTQLSAQDPLNPTDSTEFVSQLSQFSSLEGITNIGSKMDDLIKISGANNSASAVSLLGKEVKVASNEIGGPAEVQYTLPVNAQKAQISVRDANGKVVKVLSDLATTKGTHTVKVDGIEKGKYTFTVEAEDAQKQEVQALLSHIEKVSGVNFSGAVPVLLTESGREINATEVVEIHLPEVSSAGS